MELGIITPLIRPPPPPPPLRAEAFFDIRVDADVEEANKSMQHPQSVCTD